jgi:hypothetical protein
VQLPSQGRGPVAVTTDTFKGPRCAPDDADVKHGRNQGVAALSSTKHLLSAMNTKSCVVFQGKGKYSPFKTMRVPPSGDPILGVTL